MKSTLKYKVMKNKPVAKFYYQGNHSHPVRRTVLIIESTAKFLRGYELREGCLTRSIKNAKIKTYTKNKIAKVGCCRQNVKNTTDNLNSTTLSRNGLLDLVLNGV